VTLIAVLDYGIGNLRSAQKALQKVGADARLTADPGLIADAAGVVLPGVGAFGRCMEALRHSGLHDLASDAARDGAASGRPFLGICVGMQMLYRGSDETPSCAGLGIVDAEVRLLPAGVKRPQMQWNVLESVEPLEPLQTLKSVEPGDPDGTAEPAMLAGIASPTWVYFVHSFAAEPTEETIATCHYGGPVTAAIARNNLWATQFHPEKSGTNGLAILANFVAAADHSESRMAGAA